MQTIVFQLLVQVILILINAFFAATEIAVISLNANKLRKLEEEGDKLAPKLLHMVEDSSGFLSTIQIAITLSGFLGAAFAGGRLRRVLNRLAPEPGGGHSRVGAGHHLSGGGNHHPVLFHPGIRRAGPQTDRYAEVYGDGPAVLPRGLCHRHHRQAGGKTAVPVH